MSFFGLPNFRKSLCKTDPLYAFSEPTFTSTRFEDHGEVQSAV